MWMGVDKTNPAVLSRCRARDPERCPYHTDHMDVSPSEASRWMEARAREQAVGRRSGLSKGSARVTAAGGSVGMMARKTAGSERRSRVRKTLATVMAAVALAGSFMGAAAPAASAAEAPSASPYSASQAAGKLDSAKVIKMKLTSGKAQDLSSVESYDVEADGVLVASIVLKPDSKAKSWDAVMESTDGGKMGSAEHEAGDEHAATVRDAVDKQESLVSRERDESVFHGYKYKQTGDVEAEVSQRTLSLTTKHSLKGDGASYEAKAGWGLNEWTIRDKASKEQATTSTDGDVDGVDVVMNTLAVARDRAETRSAMNAHRRVTRVHRFHRHV